jgi:hypothetical protein
VSRTPEDPNGPEGEERPWEEPGAVRRDCAPHRGTFLAVLGAVSLACGFFSCCLVVPGLVGLPLGLATLVMGRRDLGLMEAGLMDPEGRKRTEEALTNAGVGIVLSLAGTFFGCLAWGPLHR